MIKNPKYLPNKKNNNNPPEITDERVKWVPVGCGNCMECRKQKKREWLIRMNEEIKHDRTGKFITLTFSNESIYRIINGLDTEGKKTSQPIKNLDGYELDNEIATIAVRRFLERWRKKHKVSVKHWLITELGQPDHKHRGTENIHLHGIIFTENKDEIEKIWQYGFVYTGKFVNERTINYCVKYSTKIYMAAIPAATYQVSAVGATALTDTNDGLRGVTRDIVTGKQIGRASCRERV